MSLATMRWTLGLCFLLVASCAQRDDNSENSVGNEMRSVEPEGGSSPDGLVEEAEVGHETVPTYHGTIKGVIEARCSGCHAEGAGAPFVMDTYASAKAMAPAALNSIETGRMPPWMPDPDCRNYKSERLMPAEEVAAFKAWVEADMPEGDKFGPRVVAPEIAGPLEGLGKPAFTAKYPELYVPNADQPDDYRCFPLDATFDKATFIRGTRVLPDQIAQVHHVLVFVINPSDVAELEQRDADEEGPGYTCFGGPGVGQNFGQIAGWAPGGLPNVSDPGYARYIPEGSRLVMQVHYNVLSGDPVPDQTAIELYAYEGEQENLLRTVPQANLGIQIPAGDQKSIHVKEFPVRGHPVTVLGTAPHMHQLGSRIRVDLVRKDGQEECLVDIKAWDFNWQQVYRFLDDEPVVAHDGDMFRLTCEYDNSEANQPVVNGEQLMPRNVRWGDGTFDEMCLNYITIVEPYEEPTATCGGLSSCREACVDDDDFTCLTDCLSNDQACSQCVLLSMVRPGGCMRDECPSELTAISGCFRDCATELIAGGDLSLCFDSKCPDEYTELSSCMAPVLGNGQCDSVIEACSE